MKWKDVYTDKQKKMLIREVVRALKDLLACPEIKGLIKEIHIAETGSQHRRDALFLTKHGLVEETHHSAKSIFEKDEDEKRSVKERDFSTIVEEYRLETEEIKGLKSKLS